MIDVFHFSKTHHSILHYSNVPTTSEANYVQLIGKRDRDKFYYGILISATTGKWSEI